MQNLKSLAFAAASAAALAACTAGQTGPPTITGAAITPQTAPLQFAVGTVNLGGVGTGLNVVSTLRKSDGTSAVLVSTPALSGPFTLPAPVTGSDSNGSTISKGGPSPNETGATAPLPQGCAAAPCIAGVPQQTPGTPASAFPYVSTFGQSGGAFGLGFAPANYTANGSPVSLTPYPVPIYAAPTGFRGFTPWGGPPAYDPNQSGRGTRDGTFPAGLNGVSLGLDVFSGVTPGAGTYTLNVGVASTGASTTLTATSTLAAVTTLPTATPPTLTFAGDGTITAAYTLPAGVTGAYVQILDAGDGTCAAQTTQGGGAYYTFWVTSSGSVTVQNRNAPLPPTTTPPTASVAACTGDTVRAWLVGFDYNHYALTYNQKLGTIYPQKPALPAAADVTISTAATAAAP